MSHNYVSGLENRVYYRCFCLECGRFDDYQISVQDWRLVIKIDDIDYSTASINHIRERYSDCEKYYAMSKKNYDDEIMREHIFNLIKEDIESILYTYI